MFFHCNPIMFINIIYVHNTSNRWKFSCKCCFGRTQMNKFSVFLFRYLTNNEENSRRINPFYNSCVFLSGIQSHRTVSCTPILDIIIIYSYDFGQTLIAKLSIAVYIDNPRPRSKLNNIICILYYCLDYYVHILIRCVNVKCVYNIVLIVNYFIRK